MSIDLAKVEQRLSQIRLSSYLSARQGNLTKALELYVWNIELSGSLFEAIAIAEVVLRNEFDTNLTAWAQIAGSDWMDIAPIDSKGKKDIKKARVRNAKNPSHGKVVAELNFGFWRFLAAKRYLHTIWIPMMNNSFPNLAGSPGFKRQQIEFAMDRLWFLRNRIGHHEPIFSRDINKDLQAMNQLLDWICVDTSQWATQLRRVDIVLNRRPSP